MWKNKKETLMEENMSPYVSWIERLNWQTRIP
jgi:hypothetical protein